MEPTSAATIRPSDADESRTREGLDAIASEGKRARYSSSFLCRSKTLPSTANIFDRLLRPVHRISPRGRGAPLQLNDAATLAAFAQKNVGFCNIDQRVLGRSLAPTEHVTGTIGYIRLHAAITKHWFADQGSASDKRNDRYNYLYNRQELAS